MDKGSIKRVNLALQGTGAHGAFGWGILDKLLEDGRIDIDGITATSAGALNAVVYAYGHMKGGKEAARAQLETFWRKASDQAIWGHPAAWRWLGPLTQVMSPYEFNPLN